MIESEFKEMLILIRNHSLEDILRNKQTLLLLTSELHEEKKLISNEVRRAILYFQLSNRYKKKRIAYIEDVIMPKEHKNLRAGVESFLPDSKIMSLNRVKTFRREREKLLKTKQEHGLRVKKNVRDLLTIHNELKSLEDQYEMLSQLEIVRNFLIQNSISIDGIIDDHAMRLHRLFIQKGGL